jgi:hypothetical protein
VDVTDPTTIVRNYRLWLPLTENELMTFVSECATSLPEWVLEEPAAKKQKRGEPVVLPTLTSRHVDRRSSLLPIFRLYREARGTHLLSVDTTPVDTLGTAPPNHLITLLSAEQYFSAPETIAKMALLGVSATQSNLGRYIHSTVGSTTFVLEFPESVVEAGLVRRFDPGFLSTGDDLLKYLLPSKIPGKHQLHVTIESALNATGARHTMDQSVDPVRVRTDATDKFIDPHMYGPIADTGDSAYGATSLEAMLDMVYPVTARIKMAYIRRLAAVTTRTQTEQLVQECVTECRTLYSAAVDGVPTVYHTLLKEMHQNLVVMRANNHCSPPIMLARKMFYRSHPKGHTRFCATIMGMCAGICNIMRLMPAQKKLFLSLISRSFGICRNHVGAHGFLIATGPSETGKSKACELWMACLAATLKSVNDGRSAKAYTAHNPDADLRCEFQDEMKDLLNEDSANVKAQQTLLSNGLIVTERLVRNNDGNFVLDKTANACRKLTVTCTNCLDRVPDAIKSRASIIAVPAMQSGPKENTAATMAAMGMHSQDRISSAFKLFSQSLVSLQAAYWSIEAAGAIPEINDTMILLYKTIANIYPNVPELSARKVGDIRHIATSLMVLDLTSRWYRQGVGADHDFDPTAEVLFYGLNSVIQMQHVVAAVCISHDSTNITHEIQQVKETIKDMIRINNQYEAVISPEGDYFVLTTTRIKFPEDVAMANTALGPGLSKTILKTIHQGVTNGLPNIKYDAVDGKETVMLNIAFIADTNTPTEHRILDSLRTLCLNRELFSISFDEEYYVFKSSTRDAIYHPTTTTSRRTFPKLAACTGGQLRLALSLLKERRVLSTNAAAWSIPDQLPCASFKSAPTDFTTPSKTRPGQHMVIRQEVMPLVVHKDLIHNPDTIDPAAKDATVVYNTCLSVAGSYKNQGVFAGLQTVGGNTCNLLRVDNEEIDITVDNPLYITPGSLDMLLDIEEVSANAVFPSDQPTIHLTHTSRVEHTCFQHHARTYYNSDLHSSYSTAR